MISSAHRAYRIGIGPRRCLGVKFEGSTAAVEMEKCHSSCITPHSRIAGPQRDIMLVLYSTEEIGSMWYRAVDGIACTSNRVDGMLCKI